MGGMLHARRGTVVGLLSIATYLFIQFSQDFLTLVGSGTRLSLGYCSYLHPVVPPLACSWFSTPEDSCVLLGGVSASSWGAAVAAPLLTP
jgi:hypothetical protein